MQVFTFNARPVPNFAKTGLPPRVLPSPVHPEPFHLRTDARGEIHSARFKQEVGSLYEVRLLYVMLAMGSEGVDPFSNSHTHTHTHTCKHTHIHCHFGDYYYIFLSPFV